MSVKVGPAHFIQPQQAIPVRRNALTIKICLIISNLKRKEIRLEGRKLSRLALHLVLFIPRCTFYPCWFKNFTATKGLEDNTYNMPDSLNQLDWTSLSKC